MSWLTSTFESVQLGRVLRLRRDDPLADDGIVTAFRDGQVTLRSLRRTDGFTEAIQEVGYQRVCRGDLVIHAMDAFAGAIGVSEATGKCSPVCQVLVPGSEVDGRYVVYALREGARAGYIQSLARGIRERSTDFRWAQAKNVTIPLPARAEQTLIADFLDHECARIEMLRQELTDAIDLARREFDHRLDASLADHAGEWGTVKLAWHLEILSGFAFPSDGFKETSDDAVRLLRGINVGVGVLRWDETVYWPNDQASALERFRLHEGDLVLGMDRPWIGAGLRVANVTASDLPALLLQRVVCLRSRSGTVDLEYVRLWLESRHFRAAVEAEMTGVSVPHISPGQVGAMRIAAAPLQTQRDLVGSVHRAAARVSDLKREADAMTRGLLRYRDALITEAVTGKLDIKTLTETRMDESLAAVREGESPEVLAS